VPFKTVATDFASTPVWVETAAISSDLFTG
jgi:hypothetical protein